MNLRQVRSGTFALFVAGVLVLLAGTYTENGGFQLAGGLFLLVSAILAFNQASGQGDQRR